MHSNGCSERRTPPPISVLPETAQKHVTRDTHRLRATTDMLASVLPLVPRAGITRLANITGLDRVGLPVVVSVRPNGRTLSQAAGRGMTLEQATLSAAMEGIELFHAEVAELPWLYSSYVELSRHHTVIPLEHLPLTKHSLFSPLTPERWTLGRDLLQSRTVAVPLDMVVLPRRPERLKNSSSFSFPTTSNGLASGSAFIEAVTVGLLEVIERDAVACCRAAERLGRPTPRVRLDSARHFPLAHQVLEQLQRAGVEALVYDCTVDTGVPVFRAVLHESAERRVGLAEGWGAHLDAELALVRALTEAAQARVVAIAGARDDRFGSDIARLRLTDSPSRIAQLEAQPATVDLPEHQSEAASTLEQDVEMLLERMARVGVRQAIVVDLTLPEFRDVLSVVRVIVPMLGGPGFGRSPRSQSTP